MVSARPEEQTPLHDDLVVMLDVTGAAERDLFAMLPPEPREAPRTIGEWSAKDVLAHLAAWREVEVGRLLTGERDRPASDTGAAETDDEANARIQAERVDWPWERVAADAVASIEALTAAIRGTSADALRESERLVAGIGANGANHAISHLSDVARLVGPDGIARFRAFADEVEAILVRGRLPERDAAVMLYNVACHHALEGELDAARRLLTDAFRMRPDLIEYAPNDSDLAALHGELQQLASG